MKDVLGLIVSFAILLIMGVLLYTTFLGIGVVAIYVLTAVPFWTNVIGIALGCVCAGMYVATSWVHRESHTRINEVLQLDDD